MDKILPESDIKNDGQGEPKDSQSVYEEASCREQSNDETVNQKLGTNEANSMERVLVQDIFKDAFSLAKEKAQAAVKKIGGADITGVVNAVKGFNQVNTSETTNSFSASNTTVTLNNLSINAADFSKQSGNAIGDAIKNFDLTAIRGIIGEAVKDTVKITTYKIKDASKAILFRLLKIWVVWLGISVLLGNTVGGGESVFIIVLTFFTLVIYSVISTLLRLRMSSVNIAMEIPSELVTRISIGLTSIIPELMNENAGLKREMINSISNKINQILYNPISLIYNPRQVVVLIQEIFNVVQDVITKVGAYISK